MVFLSVTSDVVRARFQRKIVDDIIRLHRSSASCASVAPNLRTPLHLLASPVSRRTASLSTHTTTPDAYRFFRVHFRRDDNSYGSVQYAQIASNYCKYGPTWHQIHKMYTTNNASGWPINHFLFVPKMVYLSFTT